MLQHPAIHQALHGPGERAERGTSSPYTGPRGSWRHQSSCDATALLPQVYCCWVQPLPELGFLSPSSLWLEGVTLAVPELTQPEKPKAAKVGEKKGLNHSSDSFWLFSGF